MASEYCSGRGSFDSRIKQPRSYDRITKADIWAVAASPPSAPKSEARWFIPSTYLEFDARRHRKQRSHGRFEMLAADIDRPSPSFDQLYHATTAILGGAEFLIYTTASATEEKPKWRVLVPISEPLTGTSYMAMQQALIDAFAAHNIKCDRALARAAQIIYLPNRGAWYSWYASPGPELAVASSPMAATAREYIERWAKEAAAPKLATGNLASSWLSGFNNFIDTEELLEKYGYDYDDAKGEWRSPMQRAAGSDNHCLVVRPDDSWFTWSDTDVDAGIGRRTPLGGTGGDAFDLFKYHEFGNDEAAAIAELQNRQYGIDVSGTNPNAVSLRALANHGWQLWAGHIAAIEAAQAAAFIEDQARAKADAAYQADEEQARQDKWGGPWLKEVPFDVAANALEWAAWHAPGLIGEIVRTKAQQSTRKSLVPLMAGAITATSYLAQGKIVHRFRQFITPPALMTFLVGDSSSGKSDAMDTFYDVAGMVEDQQHILTAKLRDFASGEAVVDFMSKHTSNVLLLQNEAGAKKSAAKGNSRQEGVMAETTDTFTAFKRGIEGGHAKTAGLSTEPVANPMLSALLTSTPRKLFKTIEGADAESGWLGRYLFLPLRSTRQNQAAQEDIAYPKAAYEYVNRLGRVIPPPLTIGDQRVWVGGFRGDLQLCFHVLTYEPKAEARVEAIIEEFDEISLDIRRSATERAIYGRAAECVNRLAFVAGIAVNYLAQVGASNVEWAELVVRESLGYVTKHMENAVYDDSDSDAGRIRATAKEYFKKASIDRKFFNGFGTSARRGPTGHVEIGLNALRRRLKDNLRMVQSNLIRQEIDGLIEDGTLLAVDADLSRRIWLRYGAG